MFFFWKKSHNRLYAIFILIRISCFYIVDIYNIYTVIFLFLHKHPFLLLKYIFA